MLMEGAGANMNALQTNGRVEGGFRDGSDYRDGISSSDRLPLTAHSKSGVQSGLSGALTITRVRVSRWLQEA